ncbi:MAG: ribonuclease Z [Actinobacteria bacterium]|nr:MAG: ribonuclease Z [Actinomycetota bacterium]
MSIFFAGTGGSVPTARRGLPALLVQRGGDRLLFDCGEGTQRQLVRSVGLPEIEDVFITHLHLDHWLGLPGMIKSFDLRDRERPLRVHGPAGLAELMRVMRGVYGRLRYELSVHELEPGEPVGGEGYAVIPFSVTHRTRSFGYALVEDPRPGRFDAELAERLGVTPGPDFGRLQHGETVDGVTPEQVVGPDRPGRKLVISGDTMPCEALRVAAERAEVLVHEATFAEEEADRARQTGHSTALQAADLAREAEVRLLALTHLSTRYAGPELREEARAVFAATEVPRDFDTIEVPLPERGDPHLVARGDAGAPRTDTGR